MNWKQYNGEAMRQLGDGRYYMNMPLDPTQKFKKEIDPFLSLAREKGIILHHDLQQLMVSDPINQYIYYLPKVQKDPNYPLVDLLFQITNYKTPLVLDTGSGLIKAGFADQELPTTIFPTVVGHPKNKCLISENTIKDVYIGHEAQHMRSVLSLKFPVQFGIIMDWTEIEKIWHYTFYDQLRVEPEDHPVLLTEPAMNPARNREHMVQIMFDAFNVPFTYIAMQAVLALYSSGRTTGVVFDSGEGVSHAVPIYEGCSLPHSVQQLWLAGRDLTGYLRKLLQDRGYCFRTATELEIVRDIKEKLCYVSQDPDTECSTNEVSYTLPDGQILKLGNERFRAPEVLFKPALIGKDHFGVHESLCHAIIQSDSELRQTFLENIVLAGGTTLLPGLASRLQNEICSMVSGDVSASVHVRRPVDMDEDFVVWSGGAMLASLPAFRYAWISRQEYEECGSSIVYRKCF
ncbi:actin, clone 302-like [Protopterus annectens]|uniref:actin, clone 302-like n=1 Tax=Protopterus annectens TaxID=7888 RepID=UPI001CFC4415|nr:actin, clone 302-like [Protopterus annectens]